MERVVYDRMAELDERHWWYRARRGVISALIEREALPPKDGKLLEVGCGTGHNLPMLSAFGMVDAIEIDEAARALAEKRLGRPIHGSRLPELPGIAEGHYDLIGAFDDIEHVDDDHAAVASLAKRLKPGGKLVVTVPAHQWMWSAHDVVNHHRRRYSKAGLKALIDGSPLRLEKIGYLNSLLFPLAAAARLAGKAAGKDSSDDTLPPGPVNWAFEKIFGLERHLVGRLPLPPGLSLFAVAAAT
jgi:SAM-dependent methyltransferase